MSKHGQVLIQVGQYTHFLKRIDEPSRLAPFMGLYVHPVASYQQKKLIVTSCDPQSSVVPTSSQMGRVVMILKELGGFD